MNKVQTELIEKAKAFVKERLAEDSSGHDWFHIKRVYDMSRKIAEIESKRNPNQEINLFVVELTALLHDVDDWKLANNKATDDLSTTEHFMDSIGVDAASKKKILNIIRTMSFKGGVVDSTQHSIEGMIIQDSDRLDAIGAIGIARTFAYGGSKGRLIYDPDVKPMEYTSLDQLKRANNNHTINHFYEKLLKIKSLINTEAGKALAEKRHAFMEEFLAQFYVEWNCADSL